MSVRTTTIGSYPKPDYVPVADWYHGKPAADSGRHPADPTRRYSEYLKGRTSADEAAFDRGTQEIVREQDELGIDVPTDGEIRREHYVFYHLRHLDGFDFESLSERSMRQASWTAMVPTVRGPIAPGKPFLQHDWRVAQQATAKPVKITVPGPLTIAGSTVDAYYGDEAALCAALGEALNCEIRDLALAGCTWIQVDEPLFARHPDKALAFGIDALARCFHGVPPAVARVVHICCGYPAELDMEDYPKADPSAYFELASALDDGPVDAISLEDAHRPNELDLLERYSRSTIILGLVKIAQSAVEQPEAIRVRLTEALEHIDRDRLVGAPDCGMTMLSREVARAKLRALVAAARCV